LAASLAINFNIIMIRGVYILRLFVGNARITVKHSKLPSRLRESRCVEAGYWGCKHGHKKGDALLLPDMAFELFDTRRTVRAFQIDQVLPARRHVDGIEISQGYFYFRTWAQSDNFALCTGRLRGIHEVDI